MTSCLQVFISNHSKIFAPRNMAMIPPMYWIYLIPLLPIAHRISVWTGERIAKRLYDRIAGPSEQSLSSEDRMLLEKQAKMLRFLQTEMEIVSTKLNRVLDYPEPTSELEGSQLEGFVYIEDTGEKV